MEYVSSSLRRQAIRESFHPLFTYGTCNSISISYAAVTKMFRAIRKDLKLPDPPLDVLDDVTATLICIDHAYNHLRTPENERRIQDMLNIRTCIASYLKKAAKKKEEFAYYLLHLDGQFE